ncbi:hypothetical protein TPHA_0P01810 [Tetrapisispora phaffii CBS 4417]|uniref:Cytosolic Fe-S cluster assembly factor NAR1 n=1 Tax=Tetrapisispora phaffii (strain ATCC 24235 / CBS 4417 / NBRC 1672 / NRRL Y-8282 / UCD 70-5) TaxID=1071381 RepID=G8C2G0_TETPH|nr:hypothetical protein TPHA_0P01810 [Tetrapisispora phaffii CBS 4417]CCE66338.1 hypothetical protein TPHA_0P01810 [Tetrapisispora phaffii CBS 4417]
MSALLSAEDLNDFISPSMACIKPTEVNKENDNVDANGDLQVGKESELEKVSITLQDCLACVGCITSSEEILLSRQSYSVFLENYKNDGGQLVISISPQSRLSMANHFGLSVMEFDIRMCQVVREKFACKYVVGTQIGREISIRETNREVREAVRAGTSSSSQVSGPRLCSVCPGFVLYCEKSKPELVPYLVDIKSPQQLTGQIIKNTVGGKVYHLSVMPCFDKKLEASRQDSEGEVDCVITPKEFVKMLEELDCDMGSNPATPATPTFGLDRAILDEMSMPGYPWDATMSVNAGSSSGGFAYQYVLESQARHQAMGTRCAVLSTAGKNHDLLEHRLVDLGSGATLASSSEVYGFRNIQNMVRRLTQAARPRTLRLRARQRAKQSPDSDPALPAPPAAADPYGAEFIEVMACPKGCINGGGLLDSNNTKKMNAQLIEHLNQRYHEELLQRPLPQHAGVVDAATAAAVAASHRYTFHPIEKHDDGPGELLAMANW